MKMRICNGCKLKQPVTGDAIIHKRKFFHNTNCLLDYTRKKQQEELYKQTSKIYLGLGQKVDKRSIKTRTNRARKACHDYIRARDAGKPCISCGCEITGRPQAGHYLESKKHPFLRYEADNIHLQCYSCNRHKGGNLAAYRVNLVKRIGEERVLWMEKNKSRPVNRGEEAYKKIEQEYKKLLAELKA